MIRHFRHLRGDGTADCLWLCADCRLAVSGPWTREASILTSLAYFFFSSSSIFLPVEVGTFSSGQTTRTEHSHAHFSIEYPVPTALPATPRETKYILPLLCNCSVPMVRA